MKKLKTILQYNASKYIHTGIVVALFLFVYVYPLLIVFLLVYLYYLYRQRKSLAFISLAIIFLIGIRLDLVHQRERVALPLSAEVIKINDDHIIVRKKQKYIVYCDDPTLYIPGMTLLISGSYIEIDEMNIKHHASYSDYLKSQNITGLIGADHIQILKNQMSIYRLPYLLHNQIDQRFTGDVRTYLNLFILGDKTSIDQSIYQEARDIGISHLFAISGMHVGIIVAIINAFLGLFYIKRKTYLLWLSIIIFLYNVMTGFSVSIIRASMLSIIVLMTKNQRLRISRMDALSVIFIGFIIYQPYIIFSVGFQLSFLISSSIILVKKNLNGPLRQLWFISTVAVLFGLPIILSLNYQIGLLNIIIGPIFILMVSMMLLPGAFIVFIYPQLSIFYKYIIEGFERMIHFIHQINIYIAFNFNLWIYVMIYWVLLVQTFRCSLFKRKVYILWSFFLLLLAINPTVYLTKVIIFDVNQGDAIFLQSQGCKMLIDTGLTDDYDTVINYFKGENIRNLDALILTHEHLDHIGEANDIIDQLDVGNIYLSKPIEQIQYQTTVLSENDQFSCGKFNLLVINANQEDVNENNNSLVILIDVLNETWLLTGDIESPVEQLILDKLPKKIDHLKVAHHGSSTSTSQLFINETQVDYAYISYGKNNYGIPADTVVQRLESSGAQIMTTYEYGSIEVTYFYHYRIYDFQRLNKKTFVKRET